MKMFADYQGNKSEKTLTSEIPICSLINHLLERLWSSDDPSEDAGR